MEDADEDADEELSVLVFLVEVDEDRDFKCSNRAFSFFFWSKKSSRRLRVDESNFGGELDIGALIVLEVRPKWREERMFGGGFKLATKGNKSTAFIRCR